MRENRAQRDRSKVVAARDPTEERGRLDHRFDDVYSALHQVASRLFKAERRGHTLQPTAIVHEAYLRLAEGVPLSDSDRAYLMGAAARTMRRVLVDHARYKGRQCRGGGVRPISLSMGSDPVDGRAGRCFDILVLDEAMSGLETAHRRASTVAEYRLFGGLTDDQIADLLGFSRRTIQVEWRLARAWLIRELGQSKEHHE